MQRKHRMSRKGRHLAGRLPASRADLFREGDNFNVISGTGDAVLQIGGYSLEDSHEENTGLRIYDSSGNVVGTLGSDGVGLSNPYIGDVESDSIVTFSRRIAQQIYIDQLLGSDDNDGTFPYLKLADTFNRVSASGWNTASDGRHVWTPSDGAAGKFTVATNQAKITCDASTKRTIYVDSGSQFEEIICKMQTDKIPGAAGAWTNGPEFRAINKTANTMETDGTCYYVQLSVAGGGGIPTLTLYRQSEGSYSALTAASALPDAQNWAANTDWNIRAQCYSLPNGNVRIRAYAWKQGQAEPTTWTLTIDDGNETVTGRSGTTGFRNFNGAFANTPITCIISSFQYNILDPELLWADDTDITAGAYTYAPTQDASTGTGLPFQTLDRALREIQRYNQGQVFICYEYGGDTPIWPHVLVDGFVGAGKIWLTAGAGAVITGTIKLIGNAHFIHLGGLIMTDDNSSVDDNLNATILVDCSRHVEITMCQLQGNSPNAAYNIAYTQGSEGVVSYNQLFGAASACVRLTEGSFARCDSNRGTSASSYSVVSGIAFVAGNAPAGGGAVAGSGVVANGGGVGDLIPTTVNPGTDNTGNNGPTTTKKTKGWSSTGGSTYGMGYGTWAGGIVTQGAYGGSQNHKGMWKFPSTAVLQSKTIDAMYITMQRLNYGGSSGPQSIYLFWSTTTSLSGGEPTVSSGPFLLGALSYGQRKTFKIPGGQIPAGFSGAGPTQYNLGVFQSDGSPYVLLSPNASIKVTYH
jgi:hypothetical protein